MKYTEEDYKKALKEIWNNGDKIYMLKIPFTKYYLTYFKPMGFSISKFRISGFTKGK